MYINERLIGSIAEFNIKEIDKVVRDSSPEELAKGEIISVQVTQYENSSRISCAILLKNGDIFTRKLYLVKLIKKGSGKEVKKLTRPELMDLK